MGSTKVRFYERRSRKFVLHLIAADAIGSNLLEIYSQIYEVRKQRIVKNICV